MSARMGVSYIYIYHFFASSQTYILQDYLVNAVDHLAAKDVKHAAPMCKKKSAGCRFNIPNWSHYLNPPEERGDSVCPWLSSNKIQVSPHFQRRCNTDRPGLAVWHCLPAPVCPPEDLQNRKVQ